MFICSLFQFAIHIVKIALVIYTAELDHTNKAGLQLNLEHHRFYGLSITNGEHFNVPVKLAYER